MEKLCSSGLDEERPLMELKGMLEQRMAEADNGDVDTRSFTEIAKSRLEPGALCG